MRFVFYLSRIVFAAAGGGNTDFHGWGCEIYDGFPRICGGGSRSRILRMIISHRSHRFRGFFYLTDFAVFFAAVGYLTQISRISQIFLSHRLLTSLADFADDYLTQISRISRIFYLTDC